MPEGIHAQHATITYQEGPETASKAAVNYASAAFLVGFGFMMVGVGVGYIRASLGPKKPKAQAAKAES